MTGRHYAQGPVLIVEDDRNTAALIATNLERDGFTTVLAHDGGQAFAATRECGPVHVILDIMLPGIDGWEICRTLRKESDVPILMLTARVEEIDWVSGLAMGADDYVVKPFSPRELVERVRAILRRARLGGNEVRKVNLILSRLKSKSPVAALTSPSGIGVQEKGVGIVGCGAVEDALIEDYPAVGLVRDQVNRPAVTLACFIEYLGQGLQCLRWIDPAARVVGQ